MAQTHAERQQKYYSNRRQRNDRQASIWLPPAADKALNFLADHHKLGKCEVVNRLLLRATAAIVSNLELGSKEWEILK
jgi:hypothetical protein